MNRKIYVSCVEYLRMVGFFFFSQENRILRLWYCLHCFAWWLWFLGKRKQQGGREGLGSKLVCTVFQTWARPWSPALKGTSMFQLLPRPVFSALRVSVRFWYNLCAARNFLNVFWAQRSPNIRWHPFLVINVNVDEIYLRFSNLLVQGPFSFLFSVTKSLCNVWQGLMVLSLKCFLFRAFHDITFLLFFICVSCQGCFSSAPISFSRPPAVHTVLGSVLLTLLISRPHQCPSSIIKMSLVSQFLFSVRIFLPNSLSLCLYLKIPLESQCIFFILDFQ